MKSKEKCPKCKRNMDVHYGNHCFHCNKPEAETKKVYNLICVLKYLDKKRPGLYDRMWGTIAEFSAFSNGTIGSYMLPRDCEDYIGEVSESFREDIELVYAEYPDAEDALWEVSW
jgi:hypothetical protein